MSRKSKTSKRRQNKKNEWEEYEALCRDLVQSLYAEAEGMEPERVGKGRRNRIPGDSGYCHQIDVSVDGPGDLILVECKFWNKPIPVDAILAFLMRVQDIRPKHPGRQVHGC